MRILITPLDWGLGHATRLCPLIDYLMVRHELILAASGRSYSFLKSRYPGLQVLRVPALPLRYWRSRRLFNFGLVHIGVRLVVNFVIDRLWVNQAVRRLDIDLIISDNRFGMYTSRSKKIFISHQIFPVFPRGLRMFEPMALKIYHRILRRFEMCLIPDNKARVDRLAGQLSNAPKDMTVQYLGPLSRFYDMECRPNDTYQVVALVSGLEPHRQLLIDKIVAQLGNSIYNVLIISGRPDKAFDITKGNIRLVSHLGDRQLCSYIKGAEVVIARAGYSTVMDLVAIGQTAIIIPTPGQTEQEYIAKWLDQKEMFCATGQGDMDLVKDIACFVRKKGKLMQNLLKVKKSTGLFKTVLDRLGL